MATSIKEEAGAASKDGTPHDANEEATKAVQTKKVSF
jgi:hypothetical protein